ncbi:hypothetical protein M5K25_026718 [Dendrobium thyrsiflorum]|uniref:Uncharacterized protein n=1 Tax=Dendrobium thyrsiflorum TaxID=117978 RepID=A0ABD0TY30_DENTH
MEVLCKRCDPHTDQCLIPYKEICKVVATDDDGGQWRLVTGGSGGVRWLVAKGGGGGWQPVVASCGEWQWWPVVGSSSGGKWQLARGGDCGRRDGITSTSSSTNNSSSDATSSQSKGSSSSINPFFFKFLSLSLLLYIMYTNEFILNVDKRFLLFTCSLHIDTEGLVHSYVEVAPRASQESDLCNVQHMESSTDVGHFRCIFKKFLLRLDVDENVIERSWMGKEENPIWSLSRGSIEEVGMGKGMGMGEWSNGVLIGNTGRDLMAAEVLLLKEGGENSKGRKNNISNPNDATKRQEMPTVLLAGEIAGGEEVGGRLMIRHCPDGRCSSMDGTKVKRMRSIFETWHTTPITSSPLDRSFSTAASTFFCISPNSQQTTLLFRERERERERDLPAGGDDDRGTLKSKTLGDGEADPLC